MFRFFSLFFLLSFCFNDLYTLAAATVMAVQLHKVFKVSEGFFVSQFLLLGSYAFLDIYMRCDCSQALIVIITFCQNRPI